MGNSITGSHDVFITVSDRGIDRAIRGAFLERVAPYGLPWPVAIEVPIFNTPTRFEFRFLAPSAEIRPADFNNGTLQTREHIGIRLPFRDSAITGVNVMRRLNGELQIAIPVVSSGIFEPDLSQASVHVIPDADDEDPADGDRTSAEKMGGLAVLMGPVLASQLQNGTLGLPADFLESSLFDLVRGDGACPLAPDGTPLPATPIVRAPRVDRLRCVDAEERDTSLLIKGKASAIAISAGRGGDAAVGDITWSDAAHDVGVVVSNRLLMQELIPSAVLPALVGVDRGAVRDAAVAEVDAAIEAGEVDEDARGASIRAAEDAAITAAIAPFFAFPMAQIAPVPMTIPLPSIDDMLADGADAQPAPLAGPNVSLTSSSFSVFPGGGAPSVVRARLDMSITAPDTYAATITVDIGFDAADGRLQVEPAVQSVDVTLPGLPDGFASLFFNVIWDPILNLFVDWFAEDSAAGAVDGQLDAAFDAGSIGRELRDVMLVQDAVLDDLTFQGDLRIQRDPARDQRDRSAIIERGCLDAMIEADEGLGGAGFSLALADGEPDAVTVAGGQIAPTPGIELADMGVRPMAAATNVGLNDLHVPDLVWTSGPLAIAAAGGLVVPAPRVVGVRDRAGRFARLVVWVDLLGRHRANMTRYRRVEPALIVRERPAGGVLPADPSRVFGWDPAFLAMYVDPDHIAGGSVVVGRTTPGGWAEDIELPRFVGRRNGLGGLAMDSVRVGVTERTRRVSGALLAVPTMLQAPIGHVSWAVLDADGTEHPLPFGETDVDLGPATESNVVRCTVDSAAPAIVRLEGQDGRDVDAQFIARIEHGMDDGAGRPSIETRHRLRVSGVAHRPFGFDRWLEDFERAMAMLANIGRDPDPIGPRIERVGGGIVGRPGDDMMPADRGPALIEVMPRDGVVGRAAFTSAGGPAGGPASASASASGRGGRGERTAFRRRPGQNALPTPSGGADLTPERAIAFARTALDALATSGAPDAIVQAARAGFESAERSMPTVDALVGRARDHRRAAIRSRPVSDSPDAGGSDGRPGRKDVRPEGVR
ncbi:MAG: hypothetical protein AB8G96_15675 [Phycisphaerales bacterium]